MERIYTFLPSVLVIVFLVGVKFILARMVNAKIDEWKEKNKLWIALIVSTSSLLVSYAVTELIFRAPLIIAFDTMSSAAWCGVIVSSIIFALVRYCSWIKLMHWPTVFPQQKDLAETAEPKKTTTLQKIVDTASVVIIGILSGYFGIKFQSIWMSIFVVMVLSLVVPIVLIAALIRLKSWLQRRQVKKMMKIFEQDV